MGDTRAAGAETMLAASLKGRALGEATTPRRKVYESQENAPA